MLRYTIDRRPVFSDDGSSPGVQCLYSYLGLDSTRRFAVLLDPFDASSLVSYADDLQTAVSVADAGAPGSRPVVIRNDDHSDLRSRASDLGPEWYDSEHADVWWR